MVMMINWVARGNPSHPYLENDPAQLFDPTICAFHLGFSLGRATSGPLEGKQLTAIPHSCSQLWFSWAVFQPNTEVYENRKVTIPPNPT